MLAFIPPSPSSASYQQQFPRHPALLKISWHLQNSYSHSISNNAARVEYINPMDNLILLNSAAVFSAKGDSCVLSLSYFNPARQDLHLHPHLAHPSSNFPLTAHLVIPTTTSLTTVHIPTTSCRATAHEQPRIESTEQRSAATHA